MRGIVHINDRSIGYLKIFQFQTERRFALYFDRFFFFHIGRIRFHNIPIHPSIGQLHRFYRRLVQNDVIHIETFVTKQAHYIYSHIDGFSRNQRVVFKIIYTRKCQTIQFDRRTREMRKETDIERFKIELGIQHLIGLFFHNSYHFVFKHKWQDKHEYQDNRHGYSGNLQSFFQTFVHHSYYLFVVLLFFLPQLFCNSPMTSGHIGHFQLDKSISKSIVRRSM